MKNKGKKCSVSGCFEDAFCKGLCTKHYQQLRRCGKIKKKEYLFIPGICRMIGCNRKVFAKDLCQTCYMKLKNKEKV